MITNWSKMFLGPLYSVSNNFVACNLDLLPFPEDEKVTTWLPLARWCYWSRYFSEISADLDQLVRKRIGVEDWRRAKNCSRCLLSRENPEPSWPPWESELARSLGLRIQRFLPGSSNFRATAAANLAQIWPPPSPACRLIILLIGGYIVAAALTNRSGGWSKILVRAKSFYNDLFVVWSVC